LTSVSKSILCSSECSLSSASIFSSSTIGFSNSRGARGFTECFLFFEATGEADCTEKIIGMSGDRGKKELPGCRI
jgi:hypothetical protein